MPGLLQHLAERALGLARPLRSRQAGPARSWPQEGALTGNGQEPSELEPLETVEIRQERQDQEKSTGMDGPGDAARHGGQPFVESVARAAGIARPAATGGPMGLPKAMAQPPGSAAPRTLPVPAPLLPELAARPPRREAAAEATLPDPALLLPQIPQPDGQLPAFARRPQADIPAHRGQGLGRAAAAMQIPTEVHVSIGRVELTALAPAATAPRPARPRDNGRSLADYLRGNRGRP